MEPDLWLCMKELILRCLKTRRNTSLSVCPQTEGFVVLSILWFAKQMKSGMATLKTAREEVKIVEICNKIRGIHHRTHSDQFLVTFKEMGRKSTFGDRSIIVLELFNSGCEFDEGSIILN